MKIFHALVGIIFCTITACYAAPLNEAVKVASKGTTDVIAEFGKTHISVKITTHEVDIGMSSDPLPDKNWSNCTYSRFPCSLVDHLEISIDNNTLFVARSVFADLADLGMVSLEKDKNGHFVLILRGGDASESYTTEITFDETAVKRRILKSNEAQSTVYFASPSMDN